MASAVGLLIRALEAGPPSPPDPQLPVPAKVEITCVPESTRRMAQLSYVGGWERGG